MKLIIQIACLNEERTLPATLADLPQKIEGIDCIEWLVVDDGSTDRTAAVAQELGVQHIIRHSRHMGLAAAFQSGIDASLRLGADIIVNTDGDNQYPGRYVGDLVAPILAGKADMVVADRQVSRIGSYSFTKKVLQRLGSAVVRYVSGTDVPDAPSGFRALSRDAAARLNLLTDYTHSLETLIQAGKKNITVAHVPIEVNPAMRESRLVRSDSDYVLRSARTILRLFALYEPLRAFVYLGLPFFLFGAVLWLRFLVLLFTEGNLRGAHIQSVVVGGAAILLAVLMWCLGLIGELLATNRRLQEDTLYILKHAFYRPDARRDDRGTGGA